MSEKNRKSFTSQYKAKVALEAIRGTNPSLTHSKKSLLNPAGYSSKKIVLALQTLVFHYTINFLIPPGVSEISRSV